MNTNISLKEIEKKLEQLVVFEVLTDIYNTSKRWNKGGALIHRVRAAGFMAESGASSIKEGRTPLNIKSTFDEMKTADKNMYDGTITFLYPIIKSGIYVP